MPSVAVRITEEAGSGQDVSKAIHARNGIEPCVTVLGHIQRGGSPTHNDCILAGKLGDYAVRQLLEGESGKACGIAEAK